jgi:catechol 2,3-dioxygenase-like lactoylglutathione lyase family enzyme
MDWTLEVVVVPVSDIDRAIAFYRDQLGFNLDHDTRAGETRFAQLTPPGSGCSIVIGDLPGGQSMEPGSLKGLQLIVADASRAHDELVARGVKVGDIDVIDERDGGTLFGFADPDGNGWVVQQIKARAQTPLIPH